MGSLGTPEILLVLVLALLVFGPAKLPELGKALGRAVREFKRAGSELQETIEREADDLKRTSGTAQENPPGALPPPSPPSAKPEKDPYPPQEP